MRLSVIVPVLDEASRIGARLDELARERGVSEILVVDGGSGDDTVAIARSRGAVVLSAPRGRARQMNAGAARASGDVLLFLHADVGLPAGFVAHVERALAAEGTVAGAFRTHTVADGPRRAWMGPLLRLADLRSRLSGLPYGDQAMFVRATTFRALGGFPDLPLMEDLELSRRLRRAGRIETVRAQVTVSGRRFLARPIYYTLLVNVLPLLHRAGVPPRAFAWLYGDPR